MSSGGLVRDGSVCPGGVFVVGGLVFETAVEWSCPATPERPLVQSVVETPVTYVTGHNGRIMNVDEPRCPVQAFHTQGERRVRPFSTSTWPVVEPWPVCLKNQG